MGAAQCSRELPIIKPKTSYTKGYRHAVLKGVPYPPCIVEEAVDDLRRNFTLRDSDIVIATYPKCGTTWMQQIVLGLLHGGDASMVCDQMQQAPWLEAVASHYYSGSNVDINGTPRSVPELNSWDGSTPYGPGASRRAFKTHSPCRPDLLPWAGGLAGLGQAKVIVVVRNPKDACMSLFQHARDAACFEYSGNLDHFVSELFLPGLVEHGCFWEWHAGWEQAANGNRLIFWISYEELKRNPAAGIRRVASFLGLKVTKNVIQKVCEMSSFGAMKSQHERLNSEKEAAGKNTKKNHIRQGKSGAWVDRLQGSVLDNFNSRHEERCRELDLRCHFDFGEQPHSGYCGGYFRRRQRSRKVA